MEEDNRKNTIYDRLTSNFRDGIECLVTESELKIGTIDDAGCDEICDVIFSPVEELDNAEDKIRKTDFIVNITTGVLYEGLWQYRDKYLGAFLNRDNYKYKLKERIRGFVIKELDYIENYKPE